MSYFFQPQVKKWWVQLDISAPQIVIPESFQDPDTSMVMVDLGHLNFNNISTDKTPDSQTNTEGKCCFRRVTENYYSYFSNKTYVVGTQNSHLDETVLLSSQNTCLN